MAQGISVGQLAYEKIKLLLGEARWPPGAQLDIASLADIAHVSATPMREALHRLAAERLIDLRIGYGFFMPRPTEHELRALYRWWGRLAAWLIHEIEGALPRDVDAAAPLAGLLAASRDPELVSALTSAHERRKPYRIAERQVVGPDPIPISAMIAAGDARGLRQALARHVSLRVAAAPAVLSAACRPDTAQIG